MRGTKRGSVDAVGAVRTFFARESVLCVAGVAALASCVLVPPDAQYAEYVDWHTLALLFCLMTVVAGFRKLGVLDAAGTWLARRARTERAVVAVLVGLVFFASMAVTNDVALITFVPLSLAVLRRAGMEGRLCLVAALMTVAANLGSMLTPVGNPQNLYLFTVSGMGVGEFLQLMAPYAAVSGLLLAACVLAAFPRREVGAGQLADDACVTIRRCGCPDAVAGRCAREAGGGRDASRGFALRLALFSALFVACLATVGGLLDVRVLLAVVLACTALVDAGLLRRVDWGLLATFIALFVFVGNIGRVDLLHEVLAKAVQGNALLAAVGASQVISNVPAAVLLSGFTDSWADLIVGTDVGGLGTLIASMASVITFKAVSVGRAGARGRYLATFTLVNVVFLAVLLLLAAAL